MLLWTLLLAFACAGAPKNDAERSVALDRAYATYQIAFTSVPEIDAAALRRRMASDQPPVLVDVRPLAERKVSILPGAISLETFNADRTTYAGKDVVTYCTVGVRSGFEAQNLRKQGIDATNFRGSILAWTLEGAPLITPEGVPTKQVHVYGESWNYAAADYEAVLTNADGTVYPAKRAE